MRLPKQGPAMPDAGLWAWRWSLTVVLGGLLGFALLVSLAGCTSAEVSRAAETLTTTNETAAVSSAYSADARSLARANAYLGWMLRFDLGDVDVHELPAWVREERARRAGE